MTRRSAPGKARRATTISAIALATLAFGLPSACGGGDQLLGGRLDGGSPAGPGGAAGATVGTGGGASGAALDASDGSSGAGPVADATSDQRCGAGATISVPTARGDVCTGDIANQAFRFALCTCNELTWVGPLTTDSFDSTTGRRGTSGAVGVDGHVVAAQPYHVGGSFWIAGEPLGAPALSVVTPAASDVAKELHAGGGVVGQGAQTIGGDVYSEGNITCFGMSVGGAIHVPAGAIVTGATAAKGIVQEQVAVAKPCDCAAPAVDAALVVDVLARSNDDAANSIAPADLSAFAEPKTVDLPCGRYYFEQIDGRDLTLRIRGHAAVAVGGNIAVVGAFNVELDSGAELDIFVRGDMKLASTTTFGSISEPAKVRVYVAGASVVLPGSSAIGANIYAPTSLVSSGGALEMSGALFANRFSFAGPVTVHYDEAITGGRGCQGGSGSSCTTCKDCGSGAPACRQGACTTCSASTDCCPPLVCMGGSCVPPGATM